MSTIATVDRGKPSKGEGGERRVSDCGGYRRVWVGEGGGR